MDPSAHDPREAALPLGRLLLKFGLLSPEELEEAVEIQQSLPPSERRPLGLICVEMGFLSKERLDIVLDRFGKRIRLGDLLVHRGQISPWQLQDALSWQRRHGGRLGAILIERGVIDEMTLTERLAEQFDMAYVPLVDLQVHPDLGGYVNPIYAFRHGIVPIARIGRRLTVALHDPTCQEVIRELGRSTGLKIHAVLTTPTEVAAYARRLYETGDEARTSSALGGPHGEIEAARAVGNLDALLTRAARAQAGDLRIEPDPAGGRILAMMDGGWRDTGWERDGRGRLAGIARSLKERAGLEPHEKRRPQEGIFAFTTQEGDFSRRLVARVRTVPGSCGESLAIRIWGEEAIPHDFEEIGLSRVHRERLRGLLTRPSGVLLIAGPPGSGKRATLRSLVRLLKRPDTHVHTIEDPLLHPLDGATQTQGDRASGKGASDLLRSILEKDPDAVLIDSLSDRETADIVFAERPRGPLLVATLHAAGTVGALARLLAMGVDSRTIAGAILGVLTQRLLRTSCPDCKVPYTPESNVAGEWFPAEPPSLPWQRGAGCPTCSGTGFSDRVLVAELWVPDTEGRLAIGQRLRDDLLRGLMLRTIRCLGQDALDRVLAGHSTLEEALKIVPYEDVLYTRSHGLESEKERDARIDPLAA